MNKWWLCVIVFAALAPAVSGPLQAQDKNVEIVRVRGLDTMAVRVEKLADLYMAEHANCRIVVSGGRGHGGIEELLAKNTEVAMGAYSTGPEDREIATKKGIALAEQLIGWDGLVIVVHPSNGVSELTLDQVKGIFTGALGNWNKVGGPEGVIEVVVRDSARTGYAAYFKDFALKKAPEAPGAGKKRLISAILKEVSTHPRAIGYAPVRTVFAPPFAGTVKAAAIKKDADSPSVMPSEQTVADRSYPLIVPLLLYYDRNTAGEHTKRFVEFCAMKGL
ncbi:MAG: substrate-binding domain-containing protein [Thermodesulfobacteriota bacterium]